MDFPQYRKRFDNKSFYKIINAKRFQEVQRVGEKTFFYEIKADKYFEQLTIQDMLACENGLYLESDEEEWGRESEKESERGE